MLMSMTEGDRMQPEEREDIREVVARIRREHDERIAVLREGVPESAFEPSAGLQELVDTQDEFRERMMSKLRALLYG